RPMPAAIRIALWILLYGAWVAVASVLEGNTSAQVSKDWSFWPVSLAFFAVLAFPGIVYRYLWRGQRDAGSARSRLAAWLGLFAMWLVVLAPVYSHVDHLAAQCVTQQGCASIPQVATT